MNMGLFGVGFGLLFLFFIVMIVVFLIVFFRAIFRKPDRQYFLENNFPSKEKIKFITDQPDESEKLKILERNGKLYQKFQNLKSNPGMIRRSQILWAGVGILVLIIGELFVWVLAKANPNPLTLTNFIYPVLFAIGLATVYSFYIRDLQTKFVKMELAERCGWIYDCGESYNRFRSVKDIYPIIFNKGSNQKIKDQFWGISSDTQCAFWLGVLQYEIGNQKSSQICHDTVYAFRLSKPLPINFSLVPNNTFFKLLYGFETESSEFNQLYKIKADDPSKGPILEVLEPDIMHELIEFAQEKASVTLTFQGSEVLISVPDKFLHSLQNSFFKPGFLNEEEVNEILGQMSLANKIAQDIILKMDES